MADNNKKGSDQRQGQDSKKEQKAGNTKGGNGGTKREMEKDNKKVGQKDERKR